MARITTNSSRVGDSSLSFRLRALHQQYRHESSIWDIGCDHGQLGLSFFSRDTVEAIHLVDPSLLVIETLKKKLKDSYITNGKLFIHHQQGQEIELDPVSNCIFIAGMGGKEIGEIILHLLPQLTSNDRLIISPHRKILELRELLSSKALGLEHEELLKEDGQFYQIIVLCKNENLERVPLFGKKFWEGEVGKEYLIHQLKHFDLHQDVASKRYVDFLKSLTP